MNKQIDEIEENRVAELRLLYDFCKYNGCEEKTAVDCERCYFNKVYFRLAELECKMRNGTLKEIPENAVVLTEEEYKRLQRRQEICKTCVEIATEIVKKARKETAEKFAERLKKNCVWRNDFDHEGVAHPYTILELEELDEICKELGNDHG